MPNTPRIQKDLFYTLPQATVVGTTPDLPPSTLRGCGCEETLKVLADDTGADLNNDKSGFIWWFNDTIVEATLSLQKWVDGAWSSIETLDNNDFGTAYEYGFFTNDAGEKFIGYQLNWSDVLDEHGEGSYRVICETEDYLGNTPTPLYSYEFCLKTYTPERANKTVRVEYNMDGVYGINENDQAVKDFGGLNWYNAFRLPGFFGFPVPKHTSEFVQYNTGQRVPVSDSQEPEFGLSLNYIPFFVHEVMRTDVLQSEEIYITDYNKDNISNLVRKRVYRASDYVINYKKMIKKTAPANCTFHQTFNNFKRTRY